MDDLKKNKKTIIICILLLASVLLISFIGKNKNIYNTEERVYEEKIEKYDANQYIPIYVNENDIANKYLNDFKNLMISDLETAYDTLNYSYKTKKFGSLEKFKEYVKDQYSKSFYNMSVSEYSVINIGGYKHYFIRDTRDKIYIFKELSIMNYEVYLDDYTIEIK